MVFHVNSFASHLWDCPWHLNSMSSRLKRISEDETGFHKPFSLNLKDTVDCKMKFLDLSASCVDHSTCVCILCLTEL